MVVLNHLSLKSKEEEKSSAIWPLVRSAKTFEKYFESIDVPEFPVLNPRLCVTAGLAVRNEHMKKNLP